MAEYFAARPPWEGRGRAFGGKQLLSREGAEASTTRGPQAQSKAFVHGDDRTIERTLRSLQGTAGNGAVQRLMLDAGSQTERYSLSASIRRIQRYDKDSEQSPEEEEGRSITQPGEDSEEDVELPVITSSYPLEGDADRKIASTLTYSPSVAVSPDEPKTKGDFGYTWGNHIRTTGGKIHPTPTTYEVTTTYENPIVVKVYRDTGPHSQTNIESETDPDITKSNFPKVVSDLTPGANSIRTWLASPTGVREPEEPGSAAVPGRGWVNG
jgi:hypothetical protein